MKKIAILILMILFLGACSLFQKPNYVAEPNNQMLRQQEIVIDGVQYYWVYQKNYPGHGHLVCPARDQAIINLNQ